MTQAELFAIEAQKLIIESAEYVGDRVILEKLKRDGSVTLNEAATLVSYVNKLFTEAADDLVPDEAELVQAAAAAGGDVITLMDETGKKYEYNSATGELTPLEADAPADEEVGEEVPGVEEEVPAPEGEGVVEEGEVLTEGSDEAKKEDEATKEDEAKEEVIEEGATIVSQIISDILS